MAGPNYRLITIFGAAACAIFSAFSLVWIINAFILYRSEDFIIASETMDWMNPPNDQDATCVETLTDAQLKSLDYDHADLKCNLENDEGNKVLMRNSLAVSVHALYHLAKNKAEYPYIGDQPNPLYTQANSDPDPVTGEVILGLEDALDATMPAVLSAILKEPLILKDNIDPRPPSVNFAKAYRALHWVSDMKQNELKPGVPTDCDKIYGFNYEDDIKDYRDPNGDGTAPILLYFIENLRLGRLVNQGALGKSTKVLDTWPLNDIVVDCNKEDDDDDPATPIPPWVAQPGQHALDFATVDADPMYKRYLYAHCYAQFTYASVGTSTNQGVFAVPFPELKAGHISIPYARPTGYNDTASYDQKVRLQLGYRYGLSLWAYVPMLLCSCILLGDAIAFFFSEITMPNVIYDMEKYSDNRVKNIRDSLIIAANTQASRMTRFALCAVSLFCSFLFYTIFIGVPYGFVYSKLPRPICETKEVDGTKYGTEPDHNPNPFLGQWMGTRGGWKSDWDATWYELAAIFLQCVVLLLLPLTTTSIGRNIESTITGDDKKAGREVVANAASALERVRTSAKFVGLHSSALIVFALGVVIMIVGQSVSNANFGMAWAEGVMALKKDEFQNLIYDEVRIAELIYDQGVATVAVTVSCGLVFGALIARRYIAGLGCFSSVVFLGWMVLAFVFFFPLMIYASVRAIFDHDEATSDCSVFDHGPRGNLVSIPHKDLCILRYWSFIGGGGILFGTILLLTAIGIPDVLMGAFSPRKKAEVVYNDPPNMSRFFRQGPSMETEALYDAEDLTTPLSGYRSAKESGSTKFFQFKTNIGKTDSNTLLYAPRMGASSKR